MPDYLYLLERRLSPAQRTALTLVRDAARTEGMTSFLTGGAVRDLTSGHPVRDLDITVQGNALNLRKALESASFVHWGSHAPSQTLFLRHAGGVRVEIASARKETFAKPAHATYEWTNILEDLRRRDFTVNAMAISLNEGSYGLLMDPTNGVADLEMRTLRLVSNYGFLEDPIRLFRAARLGARLGFQMDERTKQRFDNAREEGVFAAITSYQRGYELEEIGHEETPLEMLRTLDDQGWMKEMFPAWTPSKADAQGMAQLHELQTRLQIEGIYPDISAAAMELMTARMQPKDIAALKKLFVRPGFVKEWEHLDKEAEAFAAKLTAKEASAPSASWKLLTRSAAEPVLWLGLTGKSGAIQNKYKNFFSVWPEARQKVPTALMLEMRITPELERYPELLQELFFQTMDNRLNDESALRAFLEPYSPPAPPPPVSLRKPRASKKKAAAKKEESAPAETAAAVSTAPESEGKSSPAKSAEAKATPAKTPAPAKATPAKAPAPAKAAANHSTAPAKATAPAKTTAAAKATTPSKSAGAKPTTAAKPAPQAKSAAKSGSAAAKAAATKKAAAPEKKSSGSANKSAPAKKPTTKKDEAKPAAKPAAKKAAAKGKPSPKPAKKAVPAKKSAAKHAPAKKAAAKKKR
jgi:tRNA nucleotidyltransferase (CCA-adding enzyme)